MSETSKQSSTDAIKTSWKRLIKKTAEANGDLNGNKITIFQKNHKKNNSKTVTNEHDKEIPKERYVSPEERQEIIDELRLK